MSKTDILIELRELEEPLRLAQVAIDKNYLAAALHYLEDIESEANRLRLIVERAYEKSPLPMPANFAHPNDPAYQPYPEPIYD